MCSIDWKNRRKMVASNKKNVQSSLWRLEIENNLLIFLDMDAIARNIKNVKKCRRNILSRGR